MLRNLVFIITLFLSVFANADTKYIKDVWNVRVYRDIEGELSLLGFYPSGTELSVLDNKGEFSKVVIESNGRIGWIKRSYLSDRPTHNILLEELKAEKYNLAKELTKLKEEGHLKLEKQLDNLRKENLVLKDNLKNKQTEIKSLSEALKNNKEHKEMKVYIILMLIFLSLGFLVGRHYLAIKVKARFNGMKVW